MSQAVGRKLAAQPHTQKLQIRLSDHVARRHQMLKWLWRMSPKLARKRLWELAIAWPAR